MCEEACIFYVHSLLIIGFFPIVRWFAHNWLHRRNQFKLLSLFLHGLSCVIWRLSFLLHWRTVLLHRLAMLHRVGYTLTLRGFLNHPRTLAFPHGGEMVIVQFFLDPFSCHSPSTYFTFICSGFGIIERLSFFTFPPPPGVFAIICLRALSYTLIAIILISSTDDEFRFPLRRRFLSLLSTRFVTSSSSKSYPSLYKSCFFTL